MLFKIFDLLVTSLNRWILALENDMFLNCLFQNVYTLKKNEKNDNSNDNTKTWNNLYKNY